MYMVIIDHGGFFCKGRHLLGNQAGKQPALRQTGGDMALWRSWMKDLMDGKGGEGYGLNAVFKGNTCRGLRVSGSAI
jgi:hypothetical protein